MDPKFTSLGSFVLQAPQRCTCDIGLDGYVTEAIMDFDFSDLTALKGPGFIGERPQNVTGTYFVFTFV
jgi:hypothetical protein